MGQYVILVARSNEHRPIGMERSFRRFGARLEPVHVARDICCARVTTSENTQYSVLSITRSANCAPSSESRDRATAVQRSGDRNWLMPGMAVACG